MQYVENTSPSNKLSFSMTPASMILKNCTFGSKVVGLAPSGDPLVV